MLKKVHRLNYSGSYAFAPPAEDAVINTDDISFIHPIETRRIEPCVTIHFKNGKSMVAIGEPDDFLVNEAIDPI